MISADWECGLCGDRMVINADGKKICPSCGCTETARQDSRNLFWQAVIMLAVCGLMVLAFKIGGFF
ncbi:MAG: hypothetical protein WC310_01690 [Patescibacteria group bacterium]|jgi:hypothetical protein